MRASLYVSLSKIYSSKFFASCHQAFYLNKDFISGNITTTIILSPVNGFVFKSVMLHFLYLIEVN